MVRAQRESREFFAELPARFRLNPSSNLKMMQYEARMTWTEFGFGESLLRAIEGMKLSMPNAMQCNTIPPLLQRKSQVLCAAETGSGKTLAYLLPIIHKLKAEEAADPAVREDAKPRAVILVPSNELVNQVYSVAKQISHHVKLRVEKLSGALASAVRERNSRGPLDLLISTPLQLRYALDDSLLSYGNVRHVVIDEADSLMSDDFGVQVKGLLKIFIPDLETVAIASATIPYSLTTQLDDVFPTIIRLGSPKLHMPSERVDIRFLIIDRPGNARYNLLKGLLVKHVARPTLVFCNKASKATLVHRQLTEDDEMIEKLPAIPSLLHGSMPEKQRQSIIKAFMAGEIKTLVGHVIMYDFPRNAIDFIHRAGRTGRIKGSRGLVHGLVAAKDEKLAKAIRTAIKSGGALTNHQS